MAPFLSPFLSPVYTKFKPVKGLDAFIVKRLQILMVSSFLSAPQNKSYFLSGSSFLLDIGYSWVLESWLDYSSFFFFLLTNEEQQSLLPGLTTKTISKSWVTQSRSGHRGFLGIYPSSHVLKAWISWLMHMQAPLILCCLWQHFWTKAVVASLNKALHVQRFHLGRLFVFFRSFPHSKRPSSFLYKFLHIFLWAIYSKRDGLFIRC